MGLAQREMEARGLSTITLSTIADLTGAVGVPRLAAIEHPQGRPLGAPGDEKGHLEVLRATLQAAASLERPGRVDLPFRWPGSRAQAISHPPEPPPIVGLLKRKPWLVPHLINRNPPR